MQYIIVFAVFSIIGALSFSKYSNLKNKWSIKNASECSMCNRSYPPTKVFYIDANCCYPCSQKMTQEQRTLWEKEKLSNLYASSPNDYRTNKYPDMESLYWASSRFFMPAFTIFSRCTIIQRMNRLRFLVELLIAFFIVIPLIIFILSFGSYLYFGHRFKFPAYDWRSIFDLLIFLWLPFIILFFQHLILTSRLRLHDFGASGWWSILSVVPYVNLLFYLILMVPRSDVGFNKYGPNPSAVYTTLKARN